LSLPPSHDLAKPPRSSGITSFFSKPPQANCHGRGKRSFVSAAIRHPTSAKQSRKRMHDAEGIEAGRGKGERERERERENEKWRAVRREKEGRGGAGI
jgi:hypothetical protein